jgi:Ca-activated chloride channel family protein
VTTTPHPTDRTIAAPPTVTTEIRFLKGAVPAAGGRVSALLRVQADTPLETRRRTAIDLSLVLDRSGSMGGDPIEAAKTAAHDAIDLMEDGDRIALVAFDGEIDVVFPPRPVTDRAPLHRAVEELFARGSTALHDGWVEGTQQLVDLLADGRSARVLLLTDGQANRGVTDPRRIAQDVARLREVGVATSTVGLGRGFQEDLLSSIAEAGGGRFAYAETPAALEGLIAAEVIATDATVGRDVGARWRVANERVAEIRATGDPAPRRGGVALPDLLLGLPVELPLEVTLRPGEEASDVPLGSITVAWSDGDGAPVEVTVPIVADAVGEAAYAARDEDADVVVAHVLAAAGRLYGEAMEALDRHDLDRAESRLRELRDALNAAPTDPRLDRQRARMEASRDALRLRDAGLARKRIHAGREVASRRSDTEGVSDSAFGLLKREALEERKAQRPTGRRSARPASTGPGAGRHVPTGHAVPAHGARTLATHEVPRRDGTTARLRIVQGDITEVPAEALVNPSNTRLHGAGRSVDGAVHRVGGRELTRECRAIGRIDPAHAAVTMGHRLPVAYVIHVAVPTYQGAAADLDLLEKTYRAAFSMARRMRIGHVTVPAIGTGSNGYPHVDATQRAVHVLVEALTADDGPRRIDVVLGDRSLVATYAMAIRALTT